MIINDYDYLFFKDLITVRSEFEQRKHTPQTVANLIQYLRWKESFFTFEQRKKLLRFIYGIVISSFMSDHTKEADLRRMGEYFYGNTRGVDDKYEVFRYLREDFQDGIFSWGKVVLILSNVVEIMEKGESIALDPLLRSPEVAIRDYTKVLDTEDFERLGPYFARQLNEIIYASFPKEIIEAAFKTDLLDKEHERKHYGTFMEDILSGAKQGYVKACQALIQGDIKTFEVFLKAFFMDVASYFDLKEEKDYHGLLLGLLAPLRGKTHYVSSNRESGHGRYDIAIEPTEVSKKGIVMEIKVADKSKDLKQVAQSAFEQIQEKAYTNEMEARGITDFVLIGIAFRGKKLEIVSNEPRAI